MNLGGSSRSLLVDGEQVQVRYCRRGGVQVNWGQRKGPVIIRRVQRRLRVEPELLVVARGGENVNFGGVRPSSLLLDGIQISGVVHGEGPGAVRRMERRYLPADELLKICRGRQNVQLR